MFCRRTARTQYALDWHSIPVRTLGERLRLVLVLALVSLRPKMIYTGCGGRGWRLPASGNGPKSKTGRKALQRSVHRVTKRASQLAKGVSETMMCNRAPISIRLVEPVSPGMLQHAWFARRYSRPDPAFWFRGHGGQRHTCDGLTRRRGGSRWGWGF